MAQNKIVHNPVHYRHITESADCLPYLEPLGDGQEVNFVNVQKGEEKYQQFYLVREDQKIILLHTNHGMNISH